MGLEGMTSGYDVFNNETFPMAAGSTNKRCSSSFNHWPTEGRLSLSQMTVDRLVKEKTTLSGLL